MPKPSTCERLSVLAAPTRADVPVCLGLCRVRLDAIDQGEQVVDIDAVDHVRSGGFRLGDHDSLLCLSGESCGKLLDRGECRLNALALLFGDQVGQHFAELRMLNARVDLGARPTARFAANNRLFCDFGHLAFNEALVNVCKSIQLSIGRAS